MGVDLLTSNWREHLRSCLKRTRRSLFICSPYVTTEGCRLVQENLPTEFLRSGKLSMLSDLSPVNLIQQSTDPGALKDLMGTVEDSLLWHLPRVHTKAFVFDESYAVVTSANLTVGGLYRNAEMGLGVVDPRLVGAIHRELCSFGALGAPIERHQLDKYCLLATEVQSEVAKQLKNIKSAASKRLQSALRATEDELIRWRASDGGVTSVFAKTIIFLLERHGALSTAEMHPLIQEMHSDLCDDAVDRVIDGQHFGKKWKHWVRSAQHALKARHQAKLVDGKWHLTKGGNKAGEVPDS